MENSNFVEQIINDNKDTVKSVVTGYYAVPNGCMHIGEAKSYHIANALAKKFRGTNYLLFLDNDPVQYDAHFVKNYVDDCKWLGLPASALKYASDYFEYYYECAMDLIRQGKAHVHVETDTDHTDRPVEENLRLFAEMKAGKYNDHSMTLRARLHTADGTYVDEVLYDIVRATHYRTGNKWCIYPSTAFAKPLFEARVGITYSLGDSDSANTRLMSQWVWDNSTLVKNKPIAINYGRLNIDNVILDKDYLRELVCGGYVDGWDDPRLPTISAMRRRGYSSSAIREFFTRIGVTKSNSVINPRILHACVQDSLDGGCVKVLGVVEPIKVVITDFERSGQSKVYMDGKKSLFAKPRKVELEREIYIESTDFSETPSSKYNKLALGKRVRLYGAFVIQCDRVVKNDDGIDYLECSISDDETGDISTIHWIGANTSNKVLVRRFGNILQSDAVYENGKLDEVIDPASMQIFTAYVEPYVAKCLKYEILQFVDLGYYTIDKLSTKNVVILNETILTK